MGINWYDTGSGGGTTPDAGLQSDDAATNTFLQSDDAPSGTVLTTDDNP
jgi:hypothetical protein